MDVQTISVSKTEARRRLAAYKAALKRSADTEYQAVVAGYEALAQGTPVLQYGVAIRDAPTDEKARPKLAIARADRKQVMFQWYSGETATFDASWRFNQPLYPDSLLRQTIDMQRTHNHRMYTWGGDRTEGYALVPMVPPPALAAIGGRSNLRKHLILWEVEEWADRAFRAEPDKDPLLLRPLHGDLCAVVAQWDLTELERAVMAGRRSS